MGRLIRIANWKLAVLALLFFCLFIWLGVWQLQRAEEKSTLVTTFNARMGQSPMNAQELLTHLSTSKNSLSRPQAPRSASAVVAGEGRGDSGLADLRFHSVKLSGTFDAEHSFLLDNKTFHGQIGYDVYTPFKAEGLDEVILVNRGFIPMQGSRATLPKLQAPTEPVTIIGMLNIPPTYVSLGKMSDTPKNHWPMRVEYIHLNKMSALLQRPLFPYILIIASNNPAAYASEWKAIRTTTPERHRGYALQWFALALTLLILFIALNRGDKSP
jgi:surfeit locus 1 family protein